jgi:hypothetical protein
MIQDSFALLRGIWSKNTRHLRGFSAGSIRFKRGISLAIPQVRLATGNL